MKRLFCMLLSAMIITMLPAVILAETSEEAVIMELKEHCYINPDGGNRGISHPGIERALLYQSRRRKQGPPGHELPRRESAIPSADRS